MVFHPAPVLAPQLPHRVGSALTVRVVAQTDIIATDPLLAISAAHQASVAIRRSTAILAAKLILVPARRAYCQSAMSIRRKASMCALRFLRLLCVAESKGSHANEVRLEIAVASKDFAAVLSIIVHKAGKSLTGSRSTTSLTLCSQKAFSSECLTSNIPSLDGACGSSKGFTCAGGPFNGQCCSIDGFRGITDGHCKTRW